MRTYLVSFTTKDKLRLPGLLYEPDRKTRKVALFLHGNGSSSVFYKDTIHNTIATELIKKHIAYFPFNNRGGNLIKSFSYTHGGKKKRVIYGTVYERIKECVKDIDAAVSFLRQKGYREFYLIGHSTGANKICVYNKYKKRNSIAKYVLLAGGDDTGLYYQALGKRTFQRALRVAKEKSHTPERRKLAPSSLTPFFTLSYQSLYDTINPDGDYNIFPFTEYFQSLHLGRKKLFREFAALKKPTLVVYGQHDEYLPESAATTINVLKEHAGDKTSYDFTLLQEADHSFSGKEKKLGQTLASWLAIP